MIKKTAIRLYRALLWLPAHAGPFRKNAFSKYYLLGIILAGLVTSSCKHHSRPTPTCYKPKPPETGMSEKLSDKINVATNVNYSDEKI